MIKKEIFAMHPIIRTLLATILMFGTWWPSTTSAQEAQSIIGTWVAQNGAMVIEFYDAGGTFSARYVYGRLIVEADGRTLKKDIENPDPALRSRSLADVDFVSNLSFNDNEKRWENGTVYLAASGRSGSARATLNGSELHLRAYRGTPLAGRTLVFLRRVD
jgi:uncharacterized protein (DUF2147 family)